MLFRSRKSNINNSSQRGYGSGRMRASVTDRLLNSTHALRCITITAPTKSVKTSNPFLAPFRTNNFSHQSPSGLCSGQFLESNWVLNIGQYIIAELRPEVRDGSRGIASGRIETRKSGDNFMYSLHQCIAYTNLLLYFLYLHIFSFRLLIDISIRARMSTHYAPFLYCISVIILL